MNPSAAFFDLDGTLLKHRSMVSFYKFFIQTHPELSRVEKRRKIQEFQAFSHKNAVRGRHYLNRWYYTLYGGESLQRLHDTGREWFSTLNYGDWIAPGIELLERHRDSGDQVVLVSGSSDFILSPVRDALGCVDIICSLLQAGGGRATGLLSVGPMIGTNKLIHARQWLVSRGINPWDCYAYGDHISDAAMMAFMGSPTAVCPDHQLRSLANERGWPIVDLDLDKRYKEKERSYVD